MLAGLGGALFAGAMAVVAYDAWSGGAAAALPPLLTAGVLAASLLALGGGAPTASGVLVPAAVAASGVIAPAVAFFVASTGGDFPSLRPVSLLAGALLAALYLVGPSPGHSFHLALLAVATWMAAVALAGPGGLVLRQGTLGDAVQSAGLASLAAGLAQLAGSRWLDRAGLCGMATPLLGVGATASAVGGLVVWQEAGPAGAAAALSVASVALALASRPANRRGPLWAAAAVAAAALVALVGSIGGGLGTGARALMVAGAACAVVAAAAALGRAGGPGDRSGGVG